MTSALVVPRLRPTQWTTIGTPSAASHAVISALCELRVSTQTIGGDGASEELDAGLSDRMPSRACVLEICWNCLRARLRSSLSGPWVEAGIAPPRVEQRVRSKSRKTRQTGGSGSDIGGGNGADEACSAFGAQSASTSVDTPSPSVQCSRHCMQSTPSQAPHRWKCGHHSAGSHFAL
jgi:hypothetical protein